jgi:hypothetical protein
LFDELSLIIEATQQKVALCAIDTRATGQATPRFPAAGPLFYSRSVVMAYSLVSLAAGAPLIGQRVADLLCCIEYLSRRNDVDPSRIGLFGSGGSGLFGSGGTDLRGIGESGLIAIFGTAIDRRIRALLLDRTLTDFASLIASEEYSLGVDSIAFGLLQHFDLPEVCSALAPRHLWVQNPVGPNGAALALSSARDRYAHTLKTYANAVSARRFSLDVGLDGMQQTFSKWVKAALV